MRQVVLLGFLFLSTISFCQKMDRIYKNGEVVVGEVISPFSLLSRDFQFKPVAQNAGLVRIEELDSMIRSENWVYSIAIDGANKLAFRIFQGEFDIYKAYSEEGKSLYYFSKEENILELTEANVNQIFSDQLLSFNSQVTSLNDKELIGAAKSYHESKDLKIKGVAERKRNSSISFGIGGELIKTNLANSDLLSGYRSVPRLKLILSFNLERSRFNVNYAIGGTRFSIMILDTPGQTRTIHNQKINLNGIEAQYDYFFTKKMAGPYFRIGVLLSKPTWDNDAFSSGFKYDDRAHPVLGLGIRVVEKPSIDINYSYRFKSGEFILNKNGDYFTERNHIFGLELRF